MEKEQQTLIIIKPDAIAKSLTGNILTALSEARLKIVGAKILKIDRELAKRHYHDLHIRKPHIYEITIKYLMGEFHSNDRALALVYQGKNAIDKIRKIRGATNPEEAKPNTISGRYGRINTKTGVFETVIHASDSREGAEREIKVWFEPEELVSTVFKTKRIKVKSKETTVWA
ncbi:MAG: nucleoside-diphosphate kinase [Candidatus Paceibacterota bacterium]|jgi:nucleoside-diphosphate kinase